MNGRDLPGYPLLGAHVQALITRLGDPEPPHVFLPASDKWSARRTATESLSVSRGRTRRRAEPSWSSPSTWCLQVWWLGVAGRQQVLRALLSAPAIYLDPPSTWIRAGRGLRPRRRPSLCKCAPQTAPRAQLEGGAQTPCCWGGLVGWGWSAPPLTAGWALGKSPNPGAPVPIRRWGCWEDQTWPGSWASECSHVLPFARLCWARRSRGRKGAEALRAQDGIAHVQCSHRPSGIVLTEMPATVGPACGGLTQGQARPPLLMSGVPRAGLAAARGVPCDLNEVSPRGGRRHGLLRAGSLNVGTERALPASCAVSAKALEGEAHFPP